MVKRRNHLIKKMFNHTDGVGISGAFSFLHFISMILFGMGACVVVYFQLDHVFKENRESYIRQQMQSTVSEISIYLNLRYRALMDYSHFPVMTQAVMQPQANQGNIQDFMNDLLVLGERLPLQLLNYRFEPIYSTEKVDPFLFAGYQKEQLIESAALNLSFLINPDKTRFFWRFQVPIVYHNLTEGYLIAYIDLNSMVEDLALDQQSKMHFIQFAKRENILYELGDNYQSEQKKLSAPELGLDILYRTNNAAFNSGRETILKQMVVYFIAIWGVITLLSIKLGHRYFIDPLQELRKFTSAFAEGKKINKAYKKQKIWEINELVLQFDLMIAKVQRREASLEKARKELQDLNQKLVEKQQMLVHSEKMASVGQLAAGVAHEINNPTGYIMGNLEVLKDYKKNIQSVFKQYEKLIERIKKTDGTDFNDQLETIEQAKENGDIDYIMEDMNALLRDSIQGAEKIQNIVRDLKSFSRVDDPATHSVDLNEDVIETALRLVWNEIKYKCTLDKRLSPLPVFECKPGELSQVVMNLLINASDAIEEKGTISIVSLCENDQIKISISDDGMGISEKNLLKIFDPFFTTKDIGKGTGLGLSISHGIIKKHGGCLEACSELGKGTMFTIVLPMSHVNEDSDLENSDVALENQS